MLAWDPWASRESPLVLYDPRAGLGAEVLTWDPHPLAGTEVLTWDPHEEIGAEVLAWDSPSAEAGAMAGDEIFRGFGRQACTSPIVCGASLRGVEAGGRCEAEVLA